MTPGIYDNLSFEDYAKIPAISNTALGKLAVAPAVYQHWLNDPQDKPTPAQKIGRIAHRAILEPDKFEAEFSTAYAVRPDGMDMRTKDGKAWKAEQESLCREIITFDQGEFLSGAVKAISSHSIARDMLAAGSPEVSAVSEYNGLPIKARFDWLTKGDTIVDLKTTASAEPRDFHRDIDRFGYFRQGAFYLDLAASLGLPVKYFCILAIEKDAPYLLTCHTLSAAAIDQGRDEYVRLLGRYVECKRSNQWPGYPEELYTFRTWKERQLEQINQYAA
jgi:hypothetical protein